MGITPVREEAIWREVECSVQGCCCRARSRCWGLRPRRPRPLQAAPATRRRRAACSCSRRPPASGTTRSRPAASAICRLAGREGIAVDWSEDSAVFTARTLARYDAVVFLSTTGDALDAAQQTAFEDYIRGGGGYVGIHAASDTEYDWAWYGNLVGAYFASHPRDPGRRPSRSRTPATPRPPACRSAGARTDEWYSFRTNPRGDVHVLATLDEHLHRRHDGRRPPDRVVPGLRRRALVVHRPAATRRSPTARPASGATCWAASGRPPTSSTGECGATERGNFERVTLAKGAEETGEPMGLTVLPDRRAAHLARRHRPLHRRGRQHQGGGHDPGLHPRRGGAAGIKLDPGFATNRWVYLYYAPPLSTPAGDAPATAPRRSSRRSTASTGSPASRGIPPPSDSTSRASSSCSRSTRPRHVLPRRRRLRLRRRRQPLPVDRRRHQPVRVAAASAPIDERADRNPAFDAQRTSGNTNDLRGKILRIKPAPGRGALHRPGRQHVQRRHGQHPARDLRDGLPQPVPDARRQGDRRGLPRRLRTRRRRRPGARPGRAGRVRRIAQPGNYGWPYCSATTCPTTTTTSPTGPRARRSTAPAGRSTTRRNNTGARPLPPRRAPASGTAPTARGGRSCGRPLGSPMAGPVYHYNAGSPSPTKFPPTTTAMVPVEFGRDWIKDDRARPARRAARGLGVPRRRRRSRWQNPMDMEFGPDGALYVLDYGTAGSAATPTRRSTASSTSQGGRRPLAVASADPATATRRRPCSSARPGTRDPDGDPITYAWDFTTNGSTDSTAANPSFTYTANGSSPRDADGHATAPAAAPPTT